MKAKFKKFIESIGFTKAQLITVFLCYFLCFALFLGVVVIWDPMSKPLNEQTSVVEAALMPTDTSGSWITEGRYSIDWYTKAQNVVINGTTYRPGTEQNPYIIDSAEDLAGLSWLVYTKGQADNPLVSGTDYSDIFQRKYFKQTANIDLSAYYWQPIGIKYTREGTSRTNYFSGNYDGGNHTVSGIFTPAGTTNAYSYQGLFGYVFAASWGYPITIKNIGITNSFIQGYGYVGGVVGRAYADPGTITITISNCYNTGNVTSTTTGNAYVGGVVGSASSNTTIESCYNTGSVSGSGDYVGGVVGDATTIESCYNTGSVSGSGESVGGVVGGAGSATITNCYNTGTVSGSGSWVGGVVGNAGSNTTITNCYNTGSVENSGEYVGGVVGNADWNTTIESCYNTGSVSGSSNVGGVVGKIGSTATITNCYNTGSVSGSSPVGGVVGYASGSITDCYYGANCPKTVGGINGKDVPGQAVYDPDLTPETPKTLLWYTNPSNWAHPWDFEDVWVLDSGRNDGYPSFIITYWISDPSYYSIEWFKNAQSVEIDGTTYQPGTEQNPYIIDSAEDLAGLSWLVYTKGQADNPLVEDVDYSGNYIFQGKYFKQTVNIDLSAYYWQPIGIDYTREGATRQNYFSGSYDGQGFTVSGISTPEGQTDTYSNQGLFGYVYSQSSSYPVTIQNIGITNSFIQGYGTVGGVVGYTFGTITITNCYNTGNVTGSGNYVGGVVGWAYVYSDTITITNCYNTGSVSGSGDYVGGVVGWAFGNTTITNCYNTGSVSGSSYVGGVVGDAYASSGTITITNCYNTGKVTGSSIYVGGVVGYASGTTTITNCYNTGNVTSTATSYSYVGGVVGYAFISSSGTTTITNCYNTGAVSGSSLVGGVVGEAYASSGTITITNCYNIGSVSGSSYVGGVVGRAYADPGTISITNCYNTGSVSGSGDYVGGIVGYAYVYSDTITITNCYNTGSVSGSGDYVGGVVGYACASSTTGCNISKSANFGDITVTGSSGNVGGIVGYVYVTNSSYSFKMTNCYSEGSLTVSGTSVTVGGFVGNLYADYSTYSNVKIEFCSVDLDIVVSGGSIASQGAFYGGTNGLTVDNSYSLLTKSGTVSKVISDVSTQMDNNFGYMLNFKEGKPIPLGIFHILDVATRTGIVNRINAL